jgi:hypothetical protein
MLRLSMLALLGGLLTLSGGVVGQDSKKEVVKAEKKDSAPVRVKGMLPANWGKLGLSADQRQEIYKIQAKYNADIDKLEAKIKELRGTRDKEMKAVLTADQQKKLIEIRTGK